MASNERFMESDFADVDVKDEPLCHNEDYYVSSFTLIHEFYEQLDSFQLIYYRPYAPFEKH